MCHCASLDFGSSDVPFLKRPRVAALIGQPLSSLAAGEVWHFFENLMVDLGELTPDKKLCEPFPQ